MRSLVEVLLICIAVPTLSSAYPMSNGYPIYGTKRYNRPGTGSAVRSSSLAPISSWRQQPSAVRYYPEQAYAEAQQQDDMSGFYYYPDSRRRRYQQQYLYYPTRYAVSDPVEDLEDTMRREEEGWYDDGEEANLMRAYAPADYYPAYYTKYNARPRQHSYYPEDYYDNPFDMYRTQPYQTPKLYEDQPHEEDFKDNSKMSLRHFERAPYDYADGEDEEDAWINWGSKRSPSSNTKSNGNKAGTTTTTNPSGQKELVQPRPAVQAFKLPELLEEENNSYHEKRSAPGVYNTIRKLIAMEKDLGEEVEKKAPMKKRFVASGEDFVQELNSLKKRRA